MKYITLTIFIFIFIKAEGQSLSAEVTYAFGTNNKRITKTDELKIFKGTEFKLTCNATKSRFELIKKMDSDASKSNNRFIALAGAKGVFYKDLKTKEHLKTKTFRREDFIIVNDPNDQRYKWKLTKETKIIGGYKCYKAVHIDSGEFEGTKFSIETIVYYTPDIPLQFGPIQFYGLPGLILEAQSSNYYYIAKKILFSKHKKVDIKRPSKGKEVAFKEFTDHMFKVLKIDPEKEMEKGKKSIREELKKKN